MSARGRIKTLSELLLVFTALLCVNIHFAKGQSSVGPYSNLVYPNSQIQASILVQRDISLDIPISHILLPGINLTASWFWTQTYTVDNITAISDLFDMGYRRFELDLYWNNNTSVFQVCPQQIVTNSTTNNTRVITSTISQDLATTISSSIATSFATTITTTSTSTASTPTATPDPTIPIQLANGYSCAPGANFEAVLDTIQSILSRTDNALQQAGLILLILNLHVLPSATSSNTTIDVSSISQSSLSAQINNTLGNWLYTPTTLAQERQNINASFFSDTANPVICPTAYYTVNVNNSTGIASTPNGWPSTRHLFEKQGRRFLIGFGTVDISTALYNINDDASTIFSPGTFGALSTLVPAESIQYQQSQCLGPPGTVFGPTGQENFNTSTPIGGNLTFALSQDATPNTPLSYTQVEAVVQCGLSPLIDSQLQYTNSGALSPINPIAGTIWSWLPPNEPENVTLPINGSTQNVRACAALIADTGRWVVLDCNTILSTACRTDNQAYGWSIGSQSSYFQASGGCPSGTSFDVPRTPIENQFLLAALRNSDARSIWINLNSLKATDCWTIGDASCPYGDTNANLSEQKVLVPVAASIIVLVVCFLMCLVKCHRYLQVKRARKRRRLVKGFLEYADYEGIPA